MTQEKKQTDQKNEKEHCPNCREGRMERKMFRTGSVQHPGKDVSVCPSCGSRESGKSSTSD